MLAFGGEVKQEFIDGINVTQDQAYIRAPAARRCRFFGFRYSDKWDDFRKIATTTDTLDESLGRPRKLHFHEPHGPEASRRKVE
jgi:hypothetical protein